MHIADETTLRSHFEPTMELSKSKQMSKLDRHSRRFISMSPFLTIATANKDGKADVSPRGDPPGFVMALDDKTLVIPDRPGNNRLDTMVNIVENPNIALLFFIPGLEDTLRVCGHARIVRDADVLSRCAVKGKVPKVAIAVEIDEIFFHCAAALKRSKLWETEYRKVKGDMPSLARIILDQTAAGGQCGDESHVAETDDRIEQGYRENLY